MEIRPVTIGFALEQKLYIFLIPKMMLTWSLTQDEDNHDVYFLA